MSSMKTQPKTASKPSLVEFAFLVAVCPLAGLGAALAFASVLVGLLVAGAGLVAVGVYGAVAFGLAADLLQGLRERRLTLPYRRDDSRRLSVTEIAARRRDAPPASPADAPADVSQMTQIAPTTGAAQTERVVPLRTRIIR